MVKFIEKMAVSPIKENDKVYETVLNQSLYKSKMLGDYTVLSKHHNDKERLKETLANARYITEPSKELREWFNLRARDKSKEIVPSFGLRMKPSAMFNK